MFPVRAPPATSSRTTASTARDAPVFNRTVSLRDTYKPEQGLMATRADVAAAARRIAGRVHRTPVLEEPNPRRPARRRRSISSARTSSATGAFKIRGATHAVRALAALTWMSSPRIRRGIMARRWPSRRPKPGCEPIVVVPRGRETVETRRDRALRGGDRDLRTDPSPHGRLLSMRYADAPARRSSRPMTTSESLRGRERRRWNFCRIIHGSISFGRRWAVAGSPPEPLRLPMALST